jgi:prefoldin alpha subunit
LSQKPRKLPVGTTPAVANTLSSDEAQQKFNQLVQEVRVLEAYYQEIVSRQQAMSAGIADARSALEAFDGLSKSEKSELLVPIGGGALLKVTSPPLEKLIIVVGAGVAVEKDLESARAFLNSRKQELERAITNLEAQRKEIGSRLEVERSSLQKLTEE